jgi:hypothetical protein
MRLGLLRGDPSMEVYNVDKVMCGSGSVYSLKKKKSLYGIVGVAIVGSGSIASSLTEGEGDERETPRDQGH